jgi:hypothetical protein
MRRGRPCTVYAPVRGANAVVAMRFDCNEIGEIMSEIAAYGTAVTAEPVGSDASAIMPEREQIELIWDPS